MAGHACRSLDIEGLEHRIQNKSGQDLFVIEVDIGLRLTPGALQPSWPQRMRAADIAFRLSGPQTPSCPSDCRRLRCWASPSNGNETETSDVADLWLRNQPAKIEQLRRRSVGFASQSGDLLSALNVRENLAFPCASMGLG